MGDTRHDLGDLRGHPQGEGIGRAIYADRSPSERSRGALLRELTRAYETLGALLTAARWGAFDLCGCDHVSIDHALIRDGQAAGWRPCTVPGCPCLDFDDTDMRVHEFIRKRQLAEEAAARTAERRERELREAA